MSILKRFQPPDVVGTYDQSVPEWNQPDAFARVPGLSSLSWQCGSVSTGYNGATIQAQLQGTQDGTPDSLPGDSASWTVIGTVTFTADGTVNAQAAGGLPLSVEGFRYLRVFHSLTGGPPTADVVVTSKFVGDYVG